MRKIICCIAALLLSASVLYGCGDGAGQTSPVNTADASAQTSVQTNEQSTTTAEKSESEPPKTEPSAGTTESNSEEIPSTPVTKVPVSPETSVTTTVPDTTKSPTSTKKPTTTKVPTTQAPTNAPAEGTSVTINYITNNSKFGSISGSTRQTIRYGETKTSAVTAKAALGYKFVGWSDGVKTATRSAESPSKNTTVTALFEVDALELPVVQITTETGSDVTSKEVYINGTIAISNCDEEYILETMNMEIRGRGNNSWSYDKKSYRIKLSKKQNLLGQSNGKAKVWTLIANYCDRSLLRNHIALNYGRTLDGIAFMSSAQSVDVYLNGEYRGVYLLCEQNQVNEARVNITENPDSVNTGYLLEMSSYAEDPSFNVNGKKYEIVNDLATDFNTYYQQIDYINAVIWDCWDAVQKGNQTEIEKLIDIDSVVDTYIVEELFKNIDAGWDSFYLFYDAAVSGEKLHFGPVWDFDLSGGNADESCEFPEGIWAGKGGYMQENPWYYTLMEYNWFRQKVLDRWNELKKETNQIPNQIISVAKAGYNAYCRNFEKWKILESYRINRDTYLVYDLHTFKEQYEYYAEWMQKRIDWLDSYFNGAAYNFDGKLILKGSGTKSNPYQVNSASDFLNFTLCMKNGNDFYGKYFKQTVDLDLTTLSDYTGAGSSATFAGIYDGAGHKIKAVLSGNDECIFPYVSGTVMNLITEGSITNSNQAAGICRSVRIGGVIVNCASTMTISGNYAGGIAASNQGGGGSIISCYFAGSVDGWDAASPINCYKSDRGGTYKNNYYLNTVTHTTADQLPDVGETALSRSDMTSKLAGYLNNSLSESASVAGVSASDLCRWNTVSGGNPVQVPQ